MQLLFPKSTTQTLSELKHQLNWNNVILTCTLIIYISTTLSEEERDFFFFLKQPCPTGHTDCAQRRKAEQEKKKSCAHVCGSYQATCEEPVTDNVSCLYEGEVQPNEAPLSPPTASPAVTMGRWWWQWLVTVSCTPPSPLHPSHPLLLCSTFIWPHSQPLAFNAELGSPLIKVKASKLLT